LFRKTIILKTVKKEIVGHSIFNVHRDDYDFEVETIKEIQAMFS